MWNIFTRCALLVGIAALLLVPAVKGQVVPDKVNTLTYTVTGTVRVATVTSVSPQNIVVVPEQGKTTTINIILRNSSTETLPARIYADGLPIFIIGGCPVSGCDITIPPGDSTFKLPFTFAKDAPLNFFSFTLTIDDPPL